MTEPKFPNYPRQTIRLGSLEEASDDPTVVTIDPAVWDEPQPGDWNLLFTNAGTWRVHLSKTEDGWTSEVEIVENDD